MKTNLSKIAIQLYKRYTNRSELRRRMQTIRLIIFRIRADHYFRKKEDHLDDQYLSFLESRMYRMELNVSEQGKEKVQGLISSAIAYFEKMKQTVFQPSQLNRESLIQDILRQREVLKSNHKIRSTREKLLEYLRLYNEALENLVEGQREVLQNENFVFEDGRTVKDKEQHIEQILTRLKNQAESRLK